MLAIINSIIIPTGEKGTEVTSVIGDIMYRVLELNPQLQPFAGDIELRMFNYYNTKHRLMPQGGTLKDFANAHEYFGIHRVEGGWVYREWAPSAYQLYLTGEFNEKALSVASGATVAGLKKSARKVSIYIKPCM